MNFQISTASPLEFATPCLLLPVFADEPLQNVAAALDEKTNGLLSEVLKNDGFSAALGDSRVVQTPDLASPRVVLLGMGQRDKFSSPRFQKALAKGARAIRSLKKAEFALVLPDLSNDFQKLVQSAVEALELGLASFDDFKSAERFEVLSATILIEGDANQAQNGLNRAILTSRANLKCRHLVNLPSNLKSPIYFAQVAQEIAAQSDLRVEIWDEARLLDEKMGALYAVGMGSDNPPRFIVLEYAPEGTQNDAPIALVGKGMSFDSGGYSIKPGASMEEMKDDMAGAGVVLGVMSVLRELGVQKRVLGVIASAENMINGHAMRPGDIVTARNGTTIEVLNTDAEGRLILADALSWTSEQNPACIVDFATLTGAIGIALGQEGAGLFSNDDALSEKLEAAGLQTGEKLWRLPLWEDYDDYMKGNVSDLKNIGPERRAGSIAAAIFLRHFVKKEIPWAHLDIAAVSHVRDARHLTQYGATGFAVRLILEWIS